MKVKRILDFLSVTSGGGDDDDEANNNDCKEETCSVKAITVACELCPLSLHSAIYLFCHFTLHM